MKLASFVADGVDRIGFLVSQDQMADLTRACAAALAARGEPRAVELAHVLAPPDLVRFIEGGASALRAAREAEAFLAERRGARGLHGEPVVFGLDQIRWRPPVRRPSKIVCVALNNPELFENAVKIPQDHPIYFIKVPSALIGHEEPIEIPDIGLVHPESELAVVIGKRVKRLKQEDAYDAVFGYSILDDVTAVTARREDMCTVRVPMEDPATGRRTFEEFHASPMGRYKCYDTFAPMGPWIATRDEIPDPHRLRVTAWLNGEVINEDSTANLKFHVPRVLEHISGVMTLEPGDVVTLGTASSTEKWPMRKADLRKYGGAVVITIEGIGTLRNPVKLV